MLQASRSCAGGNQSASTVTRSFQKRPSSQWQGGLKGNHNCTVKHRLGKHTSLFPNCSPPGSPGTAGHSHPGHPHSSYPCLFPFLRTPTGPVHAMQNCPPGPLEPCIIPLYIPRVYVSTWHLGTAFELLWPEPSHHQVFIYYPVRESNLPCYY